jgi:VanZ family protein
MSKLRSFLVAWGPALLMMAVIFAFSSRGGAQLPNFGGWDKIVKKMGHGIGYGLLALTYWRGLGFRRNGHWLAWLMALAYSATDEFHQSFVPGRSPSLIDVFVFDNIGAFLTANVYAFIRRLYR